MLFIFWRDQDFGSTTIEIKADNVEDAWCQLAEACDERNEPLEEYELKSPRSSR